MDRSGLNLGAAAGLLGISCYTLYVSLYRFTAYLARIAS